MSGANMSEILAPGFADPVAEAQACFRCVLDAMARPGSVQEVSSLNGPAPLCAATAAVLLTLVDHETPFWLDPAAAASAGWIAFHTGAPSVAAAAQAMFALGLSLPDLAQLSAGTDETPEGSATVILQLASLTSGARFLLSGPGLPAPSVLAVDGLPPDFAAIWQRNHALYPRGIDLILCAGRRLAALPRSVAVWEA